jgi:hypothetical protein
MKALISMARPRPAAITKAMAAITHAASHPQKHERNEVAKMVFADDRLVGEIIQRAGAPLATTTDAGFAAELTQNLVGEFLATLAPISAAATLIGQGLTVPMNSANEIKLPARTGSPSADVVFVGEAQPIPVRAYQVNDDCRLSPKKYGFIIGISHEAARRSGGEGVIRTLLQEDAAATLDGAYFSDAAGDAVTHAGMLAGLTPLNGYGGGDRVAIETDLAALSDIVAAAGSGQVAYVVSPKRAARFRIVAPDLNRELTMLPSLALADSDMVAVDPLSWAHGFGDDFNIDAGEHVAIHMSDDPLPISDDDGEGAVVAAPVRSMWQTQSIALRLLADLAFAPRRPNAVASMTALTW